MNQAKGRPFTDSEFLKTRFEDRGENNCAYDHGGSDDIFEDTFSFVSLNARTGFGKFGFEPGILEGCPRSCPKVSASMVVYEGSEGVACLEIELSEQLRASF